LILNGGSKIIIYVSNKVQEAVLYRE